uniref:Neuropeptide Y prohormone-8 n=1 Tax=Schmidtea mediterranea TaxID=79327 RepID=E3CTI5_SCHMD|nr:TPA_inf: neuropeptide Y prohormone-8 [Schmidtea mediterranea]
MIINKCYFLVFILCFMSFIHLNTCNQKRPMFDSADAFRNYLRKLNNEYMIAGRPRFGKRRSDFEKELFYNLKSNL